MPPRRLRSPSQLAPFPAEALLEPLHTLPPGTVIEPEEDRPLIVHVDGVRHQRNQQRRPAPPEPLVRIIRSDGEIYHARRVRLGPSTLEELYDQPLPRRTQAICVLRTYAPVEILE